MKYFKNIYLILFSLLLISCNSSDTMEIKFNTLTTEEINDGWELLFDGKSLEKWRDFKGTGIKTAWVAENGELVALGEGADSYGDIITKEMYSNFDLRLEWKISKGGNSGIFYGVLEDGYNSAYDTGPEYQLIDDVNFPEELEDWQQCGADYAMYPANDKKKLKKVGDWNTSRIVVKDSLVQYWLNSEKIVEFKRWTEDWKDRVKKGKWKDFPSYGLSSEGHIGLQDHGHRISFRNVKIKRL